jgi:hypothetical protein
MAKGDQENDVIEKKKTIMFQKRFGFLKTFAKFKVNKP